MQEKVRTSAIEASGVRGAVNPADLFTNRLPSEDKVHTLTSRFGCEHRSRRAAAAPLLQPKIKEEEGGHSFEGNLPAFEVTEAQVHDIAVRPHMFSGGRTRQDVPHCARSGWNYAQRGLAAGQEERENQNVIDN